MLGGELGLLGGRFVVFGPNVEVKPSASWQIVSKNRRKAEMV